jgi:hydrogenase-4 component F
MIQMLVLVPAIAGVLAFVIRADSLRRALLLITACIHTALTIICWVKYPAPILNGWLKLDALGLLFLSITSVLFLMAALYAIAYLGKEDKGKRPDFDESFLFVNAPEGVFIGCLLWFLATMTLVTVVQHFGLLWAAVEATTLSSAPLIYFHRHHRSLEATWKYLLICSVGIALALLGNIFLAVAASDPGAHHVSLILTDLIQAAPRFHRIWLETAFIFFLVGYGTKMGLAPLHGGLIDADSESPSLVAALLSGALVNCAFLGILRAVQVCAATGEAAFVNELLLVFGLLSMGFAAIFIINQTDYKRMLAYSSVEHMGILALGIGLGGAGIFGSLFHAVNHSLTKAMLFLTAGNILTVYRTKDTRQVQGVLGRLPVSGFLWLAGFLAITGSPPFGTFLSEFTILKAALDQGRPGIAIAYLILLALILVGMAKIVLKMAHGPAPDHEKVAKETTFSVVPPAILCLMVIILGLYLPPFLNHVLHGAAHILGGGN